MSRITHVMRGAAAAVALAGGATVGVAAASGQARTEGTLSLGHVARAHTHVHKRKHVKPHHRRKAQKHAAAATSATASAPAAVVKVTTGGKTVVLLSTGRHRRPTPTTTTTTPTTTTKTTTTTSTTPTTTTTSTTPATTPTTTTSTTTTSTPTTTTPTTTTTTTTTTNSSPEPTGVGGSWSLVFDDEFNGTAINTSVWNEHDGWTNQNNVTDYASNVTESGGVATLTLASSTSGATIGTNQNVLAVGDFAEARVEFAGSGTTIYDWPAWWASGPNWPAAGENDIAEGLGTLTVNYHSPSGAHNEGTVPGDWAGAYHTFGIYRGSNYCDVYWDGTLVKSYSTDDNGQAQELLFTIGAANTLEYGTAGQMKVDYVRVWAPA